MSTYEDKKKMMALYPKGTKVLVEMENIKDPKQSPFKTVIYLIFIIFLIIQGTVVNLIANDKLRKDVQAEVEIDEKKIKVSIVRLSRICQSDLINVSDMSQVSPINTKDLLTNIKNRYDENQIFTNVGETLIITNPYQIIPGLYTEEKMQEIIDYCKENSIERYERGQPHCFDITMHSIFDLLNQSKNQALVISGESGAR